LSIFGSPAKALIHPEQRGYSNFEKHAKPCVYMGPPHNSNSWSHAAVWEGKYYYDVDIGCTSVDERVVMERSKRNHPCHQPFGQQEKTIANVKVDVVQPVDDLMDKTTLDAAPPASTPFVWTLGCVLPDDEFVLGLYGGPSRPGDVGSWMMETGKAKGSKVWFLNIDVKVGGQEHNTQLLHIREGVLELAKLPACVGILHADPCDPFTAVRYNQPGPPVLFDIDNPDGMCMDDPNNNRKIEDAIARTKFTVECAKAVLDHGGFVIGEHPASQGDKSPYSAKGREKHSTIADTTVFTDYSKDYKIESIHTDQCAHGADSRKPTTFECSPNVAPRVRRVIGVKHCTHKAEEHVKKLTGTNENGKFETENSELFPSPLCEGLASVIIEHVISTKVNQVQCVEAADEGDATANVFPIGTRVEVFWTGENKWYSGLVTDSVVKKGDVYGKRKYRREIEVHYDDDNLKVRHSLHNNTVRIEHTSTVGRASTLSIFWRAKTLE